MAFVLENHFEPSLPRTLLVEFARVVQGVTDERGGELRASDIRVFDRTYLEVEALSASIATPSSKTPWMMAPKAPGARCPCWSRPGPELGSAEGNGPIEAFVHAVERAINERFAVDHYHEQSESSGPVRQRCASSA